jgi:hypothetical protein
LSLSSRCKKNRGDGHAAGNDYPHDKEKEIHGPFGETD